MRTAVYISGVDNRTICFVAAFPQHDGARLPDPGTRRWSFFMETEAELPEIIGVRGPAVVADLAANGYCLLTLPASPSRWPVAQRQFP